MAQCLDDLLGFLGGQDEVTVDGGALAFRGWKFIAVMIPVGSTCLVLEPVTISV